MAGTTPVLVHNNGCGVTVLGTRKSLALLDRDKYNVLQLPDKGTGAWNWTRNKRFIDDAVSRGDEIRLYVDPANPLYRGGNVYQRELSYLNNRGYNHFEQVDDYWVVTRGRP